MIEITPITTLPNAALWAPLRAHKAQLTETLLELFDQNPLRAQKFSISPKNLSSGHHKKVGETDLNITYDFSKTHLTQDTLSLFSELIKNSGLNTERARLFKGEKVNLTENRAALHTALRAPTNNSELPDLIYEGQDFRVLVQQDLKKMAAFVEKVHEKIWLGSSGLPITHIVNLGIGGSDLGPRSVSDALYHYQTGHTQSLFIANVDAEELCQTLKNLNPETTLFIIASKSFNTQETLLNAKSAKAWLTQAFKKLNKSLDIAKHFVAISSNIPKAVEFGITAENCFSMSDAIGGRYSLWSSIGLPIALQIGYKNFQELLNGAHAMDRHFQEAPTTKNIPIMMALISLWYRNFWGAQSYAILPYSHRLSLLPAYLQQLEMESLGKSVLKNGQPSPHQTGGVIWGGVGTNGQHAFHQLLHQGTTLIPSDFIVINQASSALTHEFPEALEHQKILNTHAKAQMQALLQGKSLSEVKAELIRAGKSPEEIGELSPHKIIPGNRPSVGIYLDELTPHTLGQLLAAYEHKVFTLSVLLGINAFDQFGVELGKALAERSLL